MIELSGDKVEIKQIHQFFNVHCQLIKKDCCKINVPGILEHTGITKCLLTKKTLFSEHTFWK